MRKLFVTAVIVCALALSFTTVLAQSPVGLKAVGIEAGWVSPENIDATWGIAAFFDVGMPMPNLYVVPFVDYWTKSESITGTTGEFTYSDLAIGGRLKYVIPTAMPTFQPYIGAGLAAHMLKAEWDGASQLIGNLDLSETKIGYLFGGGMSFNVHERVDLVTEAWYGVVEDFNQTTVKGGFAIRL